MKSISTATTLAHPFWPVKFPSSDIGSYSPASMTHHKVFLSQKGNMIVSYTRNRCKPYGVSSSQKLLSPQLLIKRFDQVRDFLECVLGLTAGERDNTLNLLRLQAYYGYVYLKADMFADKPGCSKSTFWRTIRKLKSFKVLSVTNRFVMREHAQISNLYILDRLLIMVGRYLCEHIGHIWPEWFNPYLHMTWPEFWDYLDTGQLKLPLPS